MDFGALPPEINSARMYAGPGPESMLAAAAAWNGLAGELHSAAASYGSVISELTERAVGGAVVNGDGGRGRTLCDVDERDRRDRLSWRPPRPKRRRAPMRRRSR